MTTNETSPYHEGERRVQDRFGMRDKMERLGRRMIADAMPDQHRQFFSQLPFLVIGSLDEGARPWASIISGTPGFLTATDDKHLHVGAVPAAGDPLAGNLRDGALLGALGLEFHTRRRNRLNGKAALGRNPAEGFTIAVDQSFGNCPKYIQARAWRPAREREPGRAVRASALSDEDRELIERADAFFIASAYGDDPANRSHGVDVSHRGGLPGFVQVLDERSLVFPDYTGNFIFNTLGNIVRSPAAGLLFVDFETGNTVQLTGMAEVVWDPAELADAESLRPEARAGAQRFLRFAVNERVRIPRAVPLAWDFVDYSPHLERL